MYPSTERLGFISFHFTSPHEPRPIQRAPGTAHDPLARRPGLARQALPRHVAVHADVLDQRLQAAVVPLVAHKAQNQEAHRAVVEVGRERAEDVHLGAAHRVLVERVVPDGHYHWVDLEGGGGGRRLC